MSKSDTLRLLAIGASAAALAACAALPGGPGPAGPKAADAYASEQSFNAAAANWPASDWWTAYGDAQLNQLISEALSNSPDMAAAQARVGSAKAALGQARASLLPTLNGQASVEETKESYNAGIPPEFVPHGYNDFGDLQLNLSYDFDLWGKNRSAVAAATSDAKASEADAAETRLVLSTAVAASYADLGRLYAERDVSVRALDTRSKTLDLVSQRVTNGLDTRAELKEAEANVPAAQGDLDAIDEQIAQTRNALAALMGAGPDRGLTIQPPAAATLKGFGLPARLAADLIGRRPDVVAARWRAEAAAKRVGAAKAQFYPDVNLVAFVGQQSLFLRELFATGSDIGQVGPALTLPIFEGGKLRAGLKGAQADYASAVASYDGALVEALHQVADTTASERALSQRLVDARAALAAQEEAYSVARLRYEGGLANYQTVLIAEDDLLQRRRALVDLEARAFTLDIQLVKALGGGFAQA